MSAFAEKRALKAQIASAKKAGKSTQTIGRLQYKLNQLTKDSKGTPVKTKSGVLKSKTGIVRQTDASKKKRVVVKKKGPDFYKDAVALDKKKAKSKKVSNLITPNHVKVTGSPHAKITKSASPSSGKSPKYSFSSADDFTKVPRIKGTLPPVADRTKREQIEAYRRRFTK